MRLENDSLLINPWESDPLVSEENQAPWELDSLVETQETENDTLKNQQTVYEDEGLQATKEQLTLNVENQKKELEQSQPQISKTSPIVKQKGFISKMGESFKRTEQSSKLDQLTFLAATNFPGAPSIEEVDTMYQEYVDRVQQDPIKGDWWLENMLIGTAGLLGSFGIAAKEGGIQGATAGMSGAAIAGTLSPLAPLAEEVFTIPAAGALGFQAGSSIFFAQQGAGSVIRNLRSRGVDSDTALFLGAAAGVPYALLEQLQFTKLIPKSLQKEASNVVTKTLAKQLSNLGVKYGKDLATNVAQEDLQLITTTIAEELGVYLDNQVKDGEIEQTTVDKFWKEFKETTKQTTMSLVPLSGTGMAFDFATTQNVVSGLVDSQQEIEDQSIEQEIEKDTKKQFARWTPETEVLPKTEPVEAPVEVRTQVEPDQVSPEIEPEVESEVDLDRDAPTEGEAKKESKKTTKVYHGGNLKKLSSSQDLYVSEDKKEAINYIEQGSEREQGDSLYEIEIPENKIASEEEADNILKDLGISDEYMLQEKIGAEFGESYIGLKNVKKLYKKLKEKGYGAIRFLDSGLENKTSENIVIINQDIIKQKFKESKIVNEIDAELLLEQGYKPLINGKIIKETNNLESLFDNSETIEMVKPIDDVPVEGTPKIKNNIKYTTFTLPGGKVVIGEFKGTGAKGDSFVDEIKVDDSQRRKGVGSALLKTALEKFPNVSGQASNDVAVKMNYKLGMRAFDAAGNELSLKETFQIRKDQTSVNMKLPSAVKTTAGAVKAEKEIKLNKQYTDLLNAQAAAQSNLMLEGLAGRQKQQMEQSFEESTKMLEDLELEARTNGITLEKKITETEAIKEVVGLFKELDPEVDYQTKLDELRTLQDNIDDPLSPETPENALAQIEAAGQGLAGVEPAELAIAGENYQELRDGALVDVVKLHKGADIGTVIEERSELWYRRQEKLNPKFDKKITELRDDYYEQTGEKDDPSQSNGEWFSNRAKDNAIGAKPKGKFGDSLTRLFKKFREYADALRKSASRFTEYVKEGKVSKELKSFLDRSVSEKLRTDGEIKTIKEGTAVKTGVPNYELILKKKARTHSELKKLIPESQRVVVKKGKNEPYPHVSGSKFKDLPALEKTESNVTVTQSDINKAYNDALESAGIDQAGLPADMQPMGVDFWNDALSLPDQVRYWYEISAEAFGERFVDMTPAEIQTALAVSSAASVQAMPDLQIARTISILAQVEQGKPVTVGTPVPKTVSDALFKSLKGLKTGNFEQTFSYILGYVPEAPLSTNDRQVAAYFNISPDLLGSEGNLYEALSKFHINLRDIINKKLPEGVQPYESWQLQALPWVQMRRNKGVSLESNDLQQALDNTLVKLENAGIDVPKNPAGDMIITNELLNNPKVIDVLSPTSKQFEKAKIATVEVSTTLNPDGKKAAKLHSGINKAREGVTDLKKLNSIDKSLDEYDSIDRRNLGKLSRPNANLGGKSIVENLIQIITGKASKVSRVEYGRGVGGTYEGVFSPNIRIPLVTKFAPKGSSALDNNQTNQLLAILGDKLEQAAMASSSFTNAEPSKSPDTHSALIEHEGIIDSRDIEAIENTLNRESGLQFSFNVKKVPNGTVIDVNPHFNEDFTTTAPDRLDLEDSIRALLGDKVDIKLFDNTFISNYIKQPDYINYIKDLKNEISRRHIEKLQSQIGGTKQRISQAVKGKKEIGQVLEGYTKSDISRAEKARLRYRNDRNSLRETTKEIDRIASSVSREKAKWVKTHSSKLPTYELKKLTPEQKRLREERKRRDEIAQKKTIQEIYEDLKAGNTTLYDEQVAEQIEREERTGKKSPIYAGSINVDKQMIDDAMKSFQIGLSQLQPKKKVTWDETGRLRDEILADIEKSAKVMLKGRRGMLNSVELDVLRHIHVNGIAGLQELAQAGADQAAYKAVENYFNDVFAILSNVSSEYGRGLNILKRDVAYRRVGEAVAKLENGMSKYQKSEFAKINRENPLELMRFAKSLEKPLLMDYVYEFWYNSILSGIPTHLVNIGSNTLWMSYQIPQRALSGSVDALITKFTGKERSRYVNEIIPMMAGMKEGFKKGRKRAKEVMKTGEIPIELDTKWDLELGASQGAWARSPNEYMRKLAPAVSIVGRALRAMDVWANSIAFDADINAQAKRIANQEGLKGEVAQNRETELRRQPSNDMVEKAKSFAKYTTFMDNPGRLAQGLAKFRSDFPGGRFLVPFVNTLANITKRGYEFVPGLGLMKKKNLQGKGQYQDSASDIIAKQTVGTILALTLLNKYEDEEVTGAVPKNKAKRDAFYRQGKLPWSIKFGDKWISYRRIEPFNTVLASVTIAAETMKKYSENEIDKMDEAFFELVMGLKQNFIDSTMLKGISDLFDDKKDKNFFQRLPGTFIPYSSFWRSMNRSLEVNMEGSAKAREVKNIADGFTQNWVGGTLKLKPKLNVWGEEIVLEGGVLRQWLPFKYRSKNPDVLETELERIGVYPAIPEKKYNYYDPKIKKYVKLDIPDKIYDEARIYYGNRLKKQLTPIAEKSKNKPPESLAIVFDKIIRKNKKGYFGQLRMNMESTIEEYNKKNYPKDS